MRYILILHTPKVIIRRSGGNRGAAEESSVGRSDGGNDVRRGVCRL